MQSCLSAAASQENIEVIARRFMDRMWALPFAFSKADRVQGLITLDQHALSSASVLDECLPVEPKHHQARQ